MISIKNLKKSYPNVTPLQDVNAEIKKGEVISIIGPSGTGKSTLLRCINLLETPTAGQVFVDGEEITAKDADVCKVRQKMGMVFQSFNLFAHLMIIENIMIGPTELLKMDRQEAYDDAMRLLYLVGLADKALAYPHELSGGQKQRVAIARTLAMKPEVVLFDEPTSALDPTMVGEVLSVIKTLVSEGLTMMIVTHEMKFAQDVSTRIFYMDEGIIYEDGTPEQIFQNPQKEKTKIFINRIKSLTIGIQSKSYDFIAVNTQIEEFGRKQFLSQKQVYKLQLAFEELCVQTILPRLQDTFDMQLMISYSEKTELLELKLTYDGVQENPLEVEDNISIDLVKRMSKELSYDYTTQNVITMQL